MTPSALTPAARKKKPASDRNSPNDSAPGAGSPNAAPVGHGSANGSAPERGDRLTGHRAELHRQVSPRTARRVSGPAGGATRAKAPGSATLRTRPSGAQDLRIPPAGREDARTRPAGEPGVRTRPARVPGVRTRPARKRALRPRRVGFRRRSAGSAKTPWPARSAAYIRALPNHSLLDRIIRGRGWIPLLGVLLVGIVAMQVEVLKLNAGIGRSLERGTALQNQNDLLRASVAQLSDDQRIERMAAAMGMVMPAPQEITFIATGRGVTQRALTSIHQPAATDFSARLAASQAAALGSDASAAAIVPQGTTATSATSATGATAGSTGTSGTYATSTSSTPSAASGVGSSNGGAGATPVGG
jgi:cell division protein FtsL